jgi:hypothetical protein
VIVGENKLTELGYSSTYTMPDVWGDVCQPSTHPPPL